MCHVSAASHPDGEPPGFTRFATLGARFTGTVLACVRRTLAVFEAMNRAYVAMMGDHRPARTVIGVAELPKPGVLLTMNLTAVTR